jgi:DNA-binding Lrp family transcriptional regulator
MTEIERSLLNQIQHEFPLEPRPYRTLGDRLGISEQKCISILKQLSLKGILRSIRMVISWNKLGLSTILIGMKVDPLHLEAIVNKISNINEVTHNYLREGHFNLWFTLVYDRTEQKTLLLDSLRTMTGVEDLREFKAEKTYKIGLILDV